MFSAKPPLSLRLKHLIESSKHILGIHSKMVHKTFKCVSQALLTKAMHIEDLYNLDTASAAFQCSHSSKG